MSGENCGLPAYDDGSCLVYAAKITAIAALDVPGIPGCQRLVFGEHDKVANVLGYWVGQNSPMVGGWFVVPTTGGAAFMTDESFQTRFGGGA